MICLWFCLIGTLFAFPDDKDPYTGITLVEGPYFKLDGRFENGDVIKILLWTVLPFNKIDLIFSQSPIYPGNQDEVPFRMLYYYSSEIGFGNKTKKNGWSSEPPERHSYMMHFLKFQRLDTRILISSDGIGTHFYDISSNAPDITFLSVFEPAMAAIEFRKNKTGKITRDMMTRGDGTINGPWDFFAQGLNDHFHDFKYSIVPNKFIGEDITFAKDARFDFCFWQNESLSGHENSSFYVTLNRPPYSMHTDRDLPFLVHIDIRNETAGFYIRNDGRDDLFDQYVVPGIKKRLDLCFTIKFKKDTRTWIWMIGDKHTVETPVLVRPRAYTIALGGNFENVKETHAALHYRRQRQADQPVQVHHFSSWQSENIYADKFNEYIKKMDEFEKYNEKVKEMVGQLANIVIFREK